MSTFAINNWTKRKRICCGLRCVDAHDQQKGFECRWIGNRDDIKKSNDGCDSQLWSADAWRGHSLFQKIGFSWQWNSSRIRQQFYRWESFAMNTDVHTSGSTVKSHISLKMVFECSATRRTSFRSWFLAGHRVLPPTFFLQHQWPLKTRSWSSYVFLKLVYLTNRDIYNRVKRKWLGKNGETCVGEIPIPKLCQVDMLKSKKRETRVLLESQKSTCWLYQPKTQDQTKMRIPSEYRETPCHSDKRECLPKLRENLMDDRVPENNDSHASSSHESSSERVPARSVDLVNTVSMLTSLKTEIARSVTGLKLQRPRAEDAMAEAYTVLKILVTW